MHVPLPESVQRGRPLTTRAELAFSLEPVVEVLAVSTAALQIPVIGGLGDFVVRRGGRRTGRRRPIALRRRGGAIGGRVNGRGSLRRACGTSASRTGRCAGL